MVGEKGERDGGKRGGGLGKGCFSSHPSKFKRSFFFSRVMIEKNK